MCTQADDDEQPHQQRVPRVLEEAGYFSFRLAHKQHNRNHEPRRQRDERGGGYPLAPEMADAGMRRSRGPERDAEGFRRLMRGMPPCAAHQP